MLDGTLMANNAEVSMVGDVQRGCATMRGEPSGVAARGGTATSGDVHHETVMSGDVQRGNASTADAHGTARVDARRGMAVRAEWPEPAEVVAARLDARFVSRRRQLAAWDAEEARDLRDAIRVRLWEQFGCVTLVEYLEIRCGIEARTALDRVRVAEALGELPVLEAELECGAFAWSHVRELVRVVVPQTEEEWIRATRGASFKQVRAAVAGHARGDRPGDPTKPDDERRWFGWELKPSTIARVKAMVARLEAERGDRFVDDDDRVNALCDAVEAGGSGDKAPAQVWVTRDGHVFSHGVELDDAEAAALVCDADVMGDVDDPAARTTHAITPRKRKRLLARDGNACRVPGCRAKRYLDLHHVVHREEGGDDSDDNLVTLCGGHHRLHHAGRLTISHDGEGGLVFERPGREDG